MNAINQTFVGVPLIFGLSYNFSIGSKWLLEIGADYSALSQTSSNYSEVNQVRIRSFDGSSLQASNRFNIFIAPGYAIEESKFLYLKAGYSSLCLTQQNPNINNIPGLGQFPIPYADTRLSSQPSVNSYQLLVGIGYKF